ncbi:uncharacterized protein LOC128883861 isoform X2 [Hylaeus volcanicus]|uniref:uncharacterized protein LOC128883861 isoform X2 n=1 Tax=Hylaeus volcanicus TaxID=313075 RepID=UPI0023B85D45|nr:uncharacterized protein LOC128883861 isoform X2 [Hylaeus volcanicus]
MHQYIKKSCIGSHEMARDLHQDVVALLLSSNPLVQHKAILCSYRIIKMFPPTLQLVLPKIKDLLYHENSLIVTATISLLLELAQENTVSYLYLVPALFKCWSRNSSSWQTLKLLKLFRIFCTYESRLPPKLQDTITQIFNTTTSQSVEYEIFRLVIQFFPSTLPIVSLCLERLKNSYLNSHDMNLVLMALEFIANDILGNSCMLQVLEKTFDYQLLPQILNYLTSSDDLVLNYALCIVSKCAKVNNFTLIFDTLLQLGETLPSDSAVDWMLTLLQLAEKDNFSVITDMEVYICQMIRIACLKLTRTAEEKLAHHIKVIPLHFPQVRLFLYYSLFLILIKCEPPSHFPPTFWMCPLCETSLSTRSLVELPQKTLENNNCPKLTEEAHTHPKVSLSASPRILQHVLYFLEDYSLDSNESLLNPQSLKHISNLVDTLFGVGTLEQQRLRSLMCVTTEGQNNLSCFVIYATWFLASENILNESLRSSALMTSIAIFCGNLSQNDYQAKEFLNLLKTSSTSFATTSSSSLRVISYSLFTLTKSTEQESIQLLRELSDRSTCYHPMLTEETPAHENDFLDQPFCVLSESTPLEHRPSSNQVPMTKSPIKKMQKAKRKIQLWNILFHDPQIFLYGSFCGGSNRTEKIQEDLLLSQNVSTINLRLHVRCENRSVNTLSNVYLEQINSPVKVFLAKSLVQRSKKTSLVLQWNKENVFKGNPILFCRLYYDMQASKFSFLVPVHMPIYCVLEPLILDDTSVVLVQQTHQELLKCTATEIRHALDVTLPDNITIANYIRLALSLTHLDAYFHLANVQDTNTTVTALLTASERVETILTNESQTNREETRSVFSGASTAFFKKSLPLVFVTLSCVVQSESQSASQIQTKPTDLSFYINTTVQTNTPHYSERCASDLADVLVKVLKQQEFIKQRL